jgi:hypothetical protein
LHKCRLVRESGAVASYKASIDARTAVRARRSERAHPPRSNYWVEGMPDRGPPVTGLMAFTLRIVSIPNRLSATVELFQPEKFSLFSEIDCA